MMTRRRGTPTLGILTITLRPRGALGRSFGERHDRSNYHLFTRGVDFSEPVGLLVRLHGDGAEEYLYPEGLSACLARVAETHNLITLVPQTPDRYSMTWWRDLEGNVDWLNSLVAKISAEYSVDAESVWWMGYSGGAELISYGLIPYSAESVTGGAILLGGGGAPELDRLDVDVSMREAMPLYWVTGQRDDGTDPAEPFNAIEAAAEGAQWYRGHGFARVHTDFPAEYDHFTLPHAAILQEVWQLKQGIRYADSFLILILQLDKFGGGRFSGLKVGKLIRRWTEFRGMLAFLLYGAVLRDSMTP